MWKPNEIYTRLPASSTVSLNIFAFFSFFSRYVYLSNKNKQTKKKNKQTKKAFLIQEISISKIIFFTEKYGYWKKCLFTNYGFQKNEFMYRDTEKCVTVYNFLQKCLKFHLY